MLLWRASCLIIMDKWNVWWLRYNGDWMNSIPGIIASDK